ncbi:S41 family peptidase [Fluviicola sp.]|uniref:S41 family peptidase n=1 Tax=Fluviicola sp. TaxID=1917219 RepID=UPI003D2C5CAF
MKKGNQMILKQILVILLVGVAYSGNLLSQNTSFSRGKMLTKENAIKDFGILHSSLINYHPAPFFYVNEVDFTAFYESQKASITDSLSEMDFLFLCRKLVSQIRCGHTQALPSDNWFASVKGLDNQIPFEMKHVEGKIYISNTVDDSLDFQINDELISVNNRPVQDIIDELLAMETGDGFTQVFRNALIEKRFGIYMLFLSGIPQEYVIEFRNSKGEIKQAAVQPTKKRAVELVKPALPDNLNKILETSWSSFSFDSDANLGYLRIRSFMEKKEYKKYYKQVFKYLKQHPNSKLIIDLRENSGGDFRHGNRFLTYLSSEKVLLNFERPRKKRTENEYVKYSGWDKLVQFAFAVKPRKYKAEGQITETFTYRPKKNAFKGKLYVITNGITFSQAALVSSHLREHGAVFFGQETGGAELGCNGILTYKLVLPNSGIKLDIPAYHVKSNSTKGEFGRGVKPDFPIALTVDNTIDHTLMEVLRIVRKD